MFLVDVNVTHLSRVWAQVVDTTAAAEGSRANIISLPSSNKDDGKLELPPPNRFAAALCSVLGDFAPGDAFANALLLGHHPLVSHSAKGAKSVWGGIARRAFGGEKEIDKLLQDGAIAANVTARLISAMQSQVKSDRCAVLFRGECPNLNLIFFLPFLKISRGKIKSPCDGPLIVARELARVPGFFGLKLVVVSAAVLARSLYS